MNPLRIGIVTGLAREARCLQRQGADTRLRVVCAAADSSRAAAAAAELAGPDGCNGLISFGVAGGLAPEVVSGDLLLPESVVTLRGEEFKVDHVWRQRLIGGLGWPLPPTGGALVGCERPVELATQKRSLWQQTKAYSVDTESHAVARAAAAVDVPFMVVRVVADPGHRTVPSWLAGTIAPDGKADLDRVLVGLLQRPWDLPGMIVLGSDFRRALKTLRRVAVRAGPLFFFSG